MEGENAFSHTLRSLRIVATATYPDNLNASPLLCHRLPPRIGEIFGGKKLCFFTQTLVRALKKRRWMRVWRRHLQRRLNANERLSSYRLNKQSLINSLEAEVKRNACRSHRPQGSATARQCYRKAVLPPKISRILPGSRYSEWNPSKACDSRKFVTTHLYDTALSIKTIACV
jgi:hypothetical protein